MLCVAMFAKALLSLIVSSEQCLTCIHLLMKINPSFMDFMKSGVMVESAREDSEPHTNVGGSLQV